VSNLKKARQTLSGLVRAGRPWRQVIDRVSAGFRLTEAERSELESEYETKEAGSVRRD